MATEKRYIDANECPCLKCATKDYDCYTGHCEDFTLWRLSPVDAVEGLKYRGLYGMYCELREAFIDYVCSGSNNLADYCLNRCPECVDKRGWCINLSDHCKGFNPAEIIPWEEVYGDDNEQRPCD
jgi:hypothetical protein